MVTSPLTPSTIEHASAGIVSASAPKTSSLSRPLKIRSSWIASVSYRRVDGVGFLAIFTREERDGQGRAIKPAYALLYGLSERAPQGVPPWVAGLVQAGIGGVSVGRAYGKVVKRHQAKHGWGYERVEGEERFSELKEMMK